MESVQLQEISTINVNILLIYHLYKRSKWCHFTEIHRKTSNFDMCLLSFISTCYFCFMKKIIYYFKRNWLRFNLPKFCCSSIYVITIVKFNNRPIQNLFNFLSKLLLISVKWCAKATSETAIIHLQNARKQCKCVGIPERGKNDFHPFLAYF